MKFLCMAAIAASLCLALPLADEDAQALPEGTGKAVVIKMCLECHTSSPYRQRRLSSDDWSNQVYDMVDRGAKGTEEELAAVVAYLTRNFGPDSKVMVNTAPLGELKMVLGFATPECEAVIQYRHDKGPFKQWQDLLKVPGIDSKKVESKKEQMAF